MCVSTITHVLGSEDSYWDLAISLNCVGLGNQTQVKAWVKSSSPLSHHTDHFSA